MVNREVLKREIDCLPDEALEEIQKYVIIQKFNLGIFENETDYLNLIKGMSKKIKNGLDEPLSECISEDEVDW